MVTSNEITTILAKQHIYDCSDKASYTSRPFAPVTGRPSPWVAMLFAYEHWALPVLRQVGVPRKHQEKVSPGLLSALGVPFTHLEGKQFICEQSGHRNDNLLNIVSGYLEFGDNEQEVEAFALYKHLQKCSPEWRPCIASTMQEFHSSSGWWNPTAPADYGLDPLEYPAPNKETPYTLDRHQMKWFSGDARRALLKGGIEDYTIDPGRMDYYSRMGEFVGGGWEDDIAKIAEGQVRNYREGRINYPLLSGWIKHVSTSFFREWVAKQTGVRKGFAVVRADAPKKIFSQALNQVVSSENLLKELGPYVARPLVWEDVSRMGVENLVTTLSKLHMDVVEPLITTAKDKIHNRLVTIVSRPDLLPQARLIFRDHPSRLRPTRGQARYAGEPLWRKQMEKVTARNSAARDYRKWALSCEGMDRDRLFLITRYMLEPRDTKKRMYFMDALRGLPEAPIFKELMMKFPAHLLPSFKDKLTSLHTEAED